MYVNHQQHPGVQQPLRTPANSRPEQQQRTCRLRAMLEPSPTDLFSRAAEAFTSSPTRACTTAAYYYCLRVAA